MGMVGDFRLLKSRDAADVIQVRHVDSLRCRRD